jgi:hypothetical protein
MQNTRPPGVSGLRGRRGHSTLGLPPQPTREKRKANATWRKSNASGSWKKNIAPSGKEVIRPSPRTCFRVNEDHEPSDQKEKGQMVTKAFIVGINDYSPAGPSRLDLNGCVSDARDMANTLVICGFAPKNLRIRTDRAATKAGILKGLDWLIKGAKKGDSLVFYYSGHGSQVVDTDGDEVDRLDEILCPHDIDFAKKLYISDDDLREIFAKLPKGVNLEVILDCCHSGTGTRELEMLGGLPDENKVGVRYLPPPLDYTFHLDYNPDLSRKRVLRSKPGDKNVVIVPGLNHTLWAACRDNQTSQEVNIRGQVRGVFTYNFCEVLRKTAGKMTRKELKSIVSAAIRRGGFEQIMQLETSAPELLESPFS